MYKPVQAEYHVKEMSMEQWTSCHACVASRLISLAPGIYEHNLILAAVYQSPALCHVTGQLGLDNF